MKLNERTLRTIIAALVAVGSSFAVASASSASSGENDSVRMHGEMMSDSGMGRMHGEMMSQPGMGRTHD